MLIIFDPWYNKDIYYGNRECGSNPRYEKGIDRYI